MKKYFLLILFTASIGVISLSFTAPIAPETPAALGRILFFDTILSNEKTVSCATCHKEKFAFADTSAISIGVLNRKGKRNAPSAMNGSTQGSFFWDGRAASLEEQALIPIANPDEMNLPVEVAVKRLNESKKYKAYFLKIFKEVPNRKNLGMAIAAFEKTLETYNTPFDDWQINDNDSGISASAKRGFELFNGKANCSSCHFGGNFNNGGRDYRNIGLYNGTTLNDSGRAAITKNAGDLGRFKIPDLRNVAITAPYMHNGMFKTLHEVIDFYNDPAEVVPDAINRDPTLSKPLNLSKQDETDIENFLLTLTDKRFLNKK